ncbi:MAG TPA: DUF2339 domain-containing protein [Aquaticitalea sp.]|nr:DUF2339 domain-containing protein [Aquaticitalea sp.]HNU58653.1 DUF2339 domain-containing protein [Aquaticitalea sp.]
MENNPKKLDELMQRLEALSRQQALFSKEIQHLHSEIQLLKSGTATQQKPEATKPKPEPTVPVQGQKIHVQEPMVPKQAKPKPPKQPSDLEKIIGESWLNKIGILILVIGVAVGAKYSIENNLISPLTRIILGYGAGIALLAFGIKLKAKFESYSAVLVSGAMAIFYFITFFAYDFYGLIPQILAFVLMVIFTVFTVFAALNYNRSVIAHIGLVGAYAVPFLLSNDSGRVEILFTYIAIINLGILAVSIKKYWKSLYYASFFLTWLIYAVWYFDAYYLDKYSILAFVFATIFFLMFYAVAITNRIIQEEKLAKRDIILILFNSFIYFGFGYGILNNSEQTEQYLGLFTLLNAGIHFVIGFIIQNKKLGDKALFYLIFGLVFAFITIAIPVQLDGNWVTLLWIAQAVLLFWIGRTKHVVMYEKISYAIMVLAFLSQLHDWGTYSYLRTQPKAFFNIGFLTSLLVASGFGYIVYLGKKRQYFTTDNQNSLTSAMSVFGPILLVATSYLAFSYEISMYFDHWFDATAIKNENNDDYSGYYSHHNYFIRNIESVVIISYTIVFFGILSMFNILKIKNKILGIIAIIFTLIALFASQTVGLFLLGELRGAYIDRVSNEFYQIDFGYVLIRYLLFACVAFGIFTLFRYAKQQFMNPLNKGLKFLAEFVLYVSVLCFLSNELVTWLDLAGNKGVFKLGLSILWGTYSLLLIYLGIFKRIKYLRIGAIVLFGITLLKLFFYDISHLNTISKTIVFISLGVLLLIISFLYNKFKDKIYDDEKNY